MLILVNAMPASYATTAVTGVDTGPDVDDGRHRPFASPQEPAIRRSAMTISTPRTTTLPDDDAWRDALQAAAAFLAGFRSPDTRKGDRRGLTCWLRSAPLRTFIPTPVFVARMSRCTCAGRAADPGFGELDAAAADLHVVVVVHLARRRREQRRQPRRSRSPATPTRTTAAVARSQRADRSARSCKPRFRLGTSTCRQKASTRALNSSGTSWNG